MASSETLVLQGLELVIDVPNQLSFLLLVDLSRDLHEFHLRLYSFKVVNEALGISFLDELHHHAWILAALHPPISSRQLQEAPPAFCVSYSFYIRTPQ